MSYKLYSKFNGEEYLSYHSSGIFGTDINGNRTIFMAVISVVCDASVQIFDIANRPWNTYPCHRIQRRPAMPKREMMDKNVFISWSGTLSHNVASALYEWLPQVIQTIEPFLSSEDIEKGVPWFSEIGSKLEQIGFGILCVTPDNISAPWMLFEAGALSKSVGQSRVTPLLFRVSISDLQGPLAQFNSTSTSEADIKKLVKTINTHLGEQGIKEKQLDKAFELCWPLLKTQLNDLAEGSEGLISNAPARSPTDILEEMLKLTRNISQQVSTDKSHSLITWPHSGKPVLESFSQLLEEWRTLRSEAELSRRRLDLLRHQSEDDIKATLWWMAEHGVGEDLNLLEQMEKTKEYSSELIKQLIEVVKQRISDRVYPTSLDDALK